MALACPILFRVTLKVCEFLDRAIAIVIELRMMGCGGGAVMEQEVRRPGRNRKQLVLEP
jgi:hypothetical protein